VTELMNRLRNVGRMILTKIDYVVLVE